MKFINIFVASSVKEFKGEREHLSEFFTELNNEIFNNQGFHLKLIKSDFMSEEYEEDGVQIARIDAAIRNSVFFFMIVGVRLGLYTRHEFRIALEEHDRRGMYVYPYFLLPGGQMPDNSVVNFWQDISKQYPKCKSNMQEIENAMFKEIMRKVSCGLLNHINDI